MPSLYARAATAVAALGSISVDSKFKIASQDAKEKGQTSNKAHTFAAVSDPPLTPVFQKLSGTFAGTGFNQIFRPNSLGAGTTPMNNPVNGGPQNNVLQLNLMTETLTFSPSIGSVPNRGLDPQPDIFLTALPYLQVIDDVTNVQTGRADGTASGIHFEPGMFVHVPGTQNNPVIGDTINRIGSIPHGTTINSQAVEPANAFPGGPRFAKADITPFVIGGGRKITFASQTANNTATSRLPQDLTNFIATGAITQDIISDPNLVLAQAIAGQTIDNTFVFQVSTNPNPAQNITGGGTANNAFLTGANATKPGFNALAAQMDAIFWIETVNWTVTVPPGKSGQTQTLSPVAPNANVTLPTFSVTPPRDINQPTNITAQSTQIQYSQQVLLNFAGLSWPHIAVNTLTQQGNINVPASAFN